MRSSPQAQMPIVASARWCEATKSTLVDAVEGHAAIEAEACRLNEKVKAMYQKHILSGQRCTSLTEEYATKIRYHGELSQAIWKGLKLPEPLPPVTTALPHSGFHPTKDGMALLHRPTV